MSYRQATGIQVVAAQVDARISSAAPARPQCPCCCDRYAESTGAELGDTHTHTHTHTQLRFTCAAMQTRVSFFAKAPEARVEIKECYLGPGKGGSGEAGFGTRKSPQVERNGE